MGGTIKPHRLRVKLLTRVLVKLGPLQVAKQKLLARVCPYAAPIMEPNSSDRQLSPLSTLNYQRLRTAQSPSDTEVLKLFDAVQDLGFFYLDLRQCLPETPVTDVGEDGILEEAHGLFGLMKKFFDLPATEKQMYSVTNNGGYFG